MKHYIFGISLILLSFKGLSQTYIQQTDCKDNNNNSVTGSTMCIGYTCTYKGYGFDGTTSWSVTKGRKFNERSTQDTNGNTVYLVDVEWENTGTGIVSRGSASTEAYIHGSTPTGGAAKINGSSTNTTLCYNSTTPFIKVDSHWGNIVGWYRTAAGGTPQEIKDTNGNSLTGTTLQASYVSATTSYSYSAKIATPCGTATVFSSPATVTVTPYPEVKSLSGGGTFCQNNSTSVAVMSIPDPQEGVDYKLYLSGTEVSVATWVGGTTKWSGQDISFESYPINRLNFAGQRTAGTYTAKASWNGLCSSLVTNSSNSVTISAIDPQITAGSIGLAASPVCYSGTEILLKETAAPSNGSNYTYSWSFVVNGTPYTFFGERGNTVFSLTFERILSELPLGSALPTSITISRKVTGITSCNTSSTASSSLTVPIRGGKIISQGILNDLSICAGSTTRLDPGVPTYQGSGTLSYLWEQSTSSTGPWSNATGTRTLRYYDTPTTLAGTMYYRRKATISQSGYACDHFTYSSPVKVTVKPKPSSSPFLSGGGTYCQNDPNPQINLTIRNPQNEVDYLLYRDGTLVKTIEWQGSSLKWDNYDASQDRISITEYGGGNYTAKAQWYNVCTHLKEDIGGNVSFTPIDPVINGGSIGVVSSPVCYINGQIQLQVIQAESGGSSYSYEWVMVDHQASPVIEASFSTTSSNTLTLDFATIKSKLNKSVVPSSLVITRKVTGMTSCGSRISSASVTVPIEGGLILSPGRSSDPETVCGNNLATLNPALVIEGDDIPLFVWQQSSDNATWVTAQGTNNQEAYIVGPDVTTTMYYRRRVSFPECNQEAFSDPVMLNRHLLNIQITAPTTVCAGEEAVLQASESTSSVTLFQWYNEQDELIHQGNTLTLQALRQTTSYRVEGIDIEGCAHPKSVTVNVVENTHRPTFSSLSKTASSDYQAIFEGIDLSLYNYYWQTYPEGRQTTDNNLNRTFTVGGTYYLRAQSKNSAGCWGPALAIVIPDLQDPVFTTGVTMDQVNFVRAFTFLDNDPTIPTNPNEASYEQVQTTTQYIDGLGRLLQSVSKQGSSSLQDVVQPHTYDALGRASKAYLPYQAASSTGDVQAQPFAALRNFYSSTSPSDVAASAYPLGYTHFEASPLSRVTAQAAPGEEWAGVTGAQQHHDLVYQYRASTGNEVLQFSLANPSAFASGEGQIQASQYYPAEALWVTISYDENQGNQANRYAVREYKDKQDRVVLKVVESESGELKTYYVYDDFDNLRAVIPPKAATQLGTTPSQASPVSVSASLGEELCFFYDYDKRQRMIHKKVPGAKTAYLVYDARDRLILSQDGNQRQRNEWSMTKYDGLNRPIITGIYTASAAYTQAQMQAAVDNFLAQNGNQNNASHPEPGTQIISGTDLTFSQPVSERIITATNSVTLLPGFEASAASGELIIRIDEDPSTVAYDYPELSTGGASYPENNNSELLILTFYDDYTFDDNNAFSFDPTGLPTDPTTGFNTSPEPKMKGQITGTVTRVLGTSDWLTTVNYYDKKGRVIQTVSDNYVGGRDVISNRYSFTGLLLESRHHHTSDAHHGSEDIWIIHEYEYDHGQRLIAEYQTIGGGEKVKLVENTYNALGELVDKALHQVGSNPAKQSVDYRYNIRGWLTHINNSDLSLEAGINDEAGDYFGMELFYTQSADFSATTQYNGNIAGVSYQNLNQMEKQGYAYSYDALNRLGKAQFYHLSNPLKNGLYDVMGPTSNNGMIKYDANGNIEHLLRYSYDNNTGGRSLMDDLSYSYLDGGNQLAKVDDAATGDAAGLGFKNGDNLGDDFLYDDNGNMEEDFNKEIIQKIDYNYLNLPQKVMIDQQGSITYVYDAAGTKLQKIVADAEGKQTVRDYSSVMQYQNKGDGTGSKLDFILHSQGRSRRTQSGSMVYDYDLQDHLGNTRVTFTTEEQTDVYVATMEEERRGIETQDFDYIAERAQQFNIMNATPVSADIPIPVNVATLNAVAGRAAGPSKILYVAKGDVVELSVKAKYEEAPSSTDPLVSGGIFTAVAAAFGISQSVEHAQLYNAIQEAVGARVFANDDGTGVPHAYLHYILFTPEMRYIASGAKPISTAARVDAANPNAAHETVSFDNPITITEPGFMYIYLSNESSWDVDVYFDDLTVSHTYNGIIQTEDYYPFGLAHQQAPDRKYNNRYLYNGKELQDELSLNWYDYGARMYDPAIGRWFAVDPLAEKATSLTPYRYGFNNPIRVTDPDGRFEYTDGYSTYDSRNSTASISFSGTYANTSGGLSGGGGGGSNDNEKGGTTIKVAEARDESTLENRLSVMLNPLSDLDRKLDVEGGGPGTMYFDIDADGNINLNDPKYYPLESNPLGSIRFLRALVTLRNSGQLTKFVRDTRFFRNPQLRNYLSTYYRYTASYGNGSSASALLHEARTGQLLSKSGHLQKVALARNYFIDILRSNQGLTHMERNFVIRQVVEANRAIRTTLGGNSNYTGQVTREIMKTVRKHPY